MPGAACSTARFIFISCSILFYVNIVKFIFSICSCWTFGLFLGFFSVITNTTTNILAHISFAYVNAFPEGRELLGDGGAYLQPF